MKGRMTRRRRMWRTSPIKMIIRLSINSHPHNVAPGSIQDEERVAQIREYVMQNIVRAHEISDGRIVGESSGSWNRWMWAIPLLHRDRFECFEIDGDEENFEYEVGRIQSTE